MSGLPNTGRGYPVFSDQLRSVPTLDNEPVLTDNGNGTNLASGSGYRQKVIQRVNVDLSSVFTDVEYDIPGTLIWYSGQSISSSGEVDIRLDNRENDTIPLSFDHGISGIPFKRFFLSNSNAQAGVTISLNVILDTPQDRVAIQP